MSGPIRAHEHGRLTSERLTSNTWPDFESLFAANGGVWGGCWCMFFHRRGEFDSKAYQRNRSAKLALTKRGKAHGTIVYCGGDPVGWCQFGPSEELPRIDGKRGYKPTSDAPWRITCLFVSPAHRRRGVAHYAVEESVRALKKLGAKVVEAYPVEGARSASLLWMGTPRLFESAGFTKACPLGKSGWVYALEISPR